MAFLESRKIQTRMLFAGNLVRQPALTFLAAAATAEGLPQPYRVAGDLKNADLTMTNAFWIGVYPGLTQPMREYVADTIRTFLQQARNRGNPSLCSTP